MVQALLPCIQPINRLVLPSLTSLSFLFATGYALRGPASCPSLRR